MNNNTAYISFLSDKVTLFYYHERDYLYNFKTLCYDKTRELFITADEINNREGELLLFNNLHHNLEKDIDIRIYFLYFSNIIDELCKIEINNDYDKLIIIIEDSFCEWAIEYLIKQFKLRSIHNVIIIRKSFALRYLDTEFVCDNYSCINSSISKFFSKNNFPLKIANEFSVGFYDTKHNWNSLIGIYDTLPIDINYTISVDGRFKLFAKNADTDINLCNIMIKTKEEIIMSLHFSHSKFGIVTLKKNNILLAKQRVNLPYYIYRI